MLLATERKTIITEALNELARGVDLSRQLFLVQVVCKCMTGDGRQPPQKRQEMVEGVIRHIRKKKEL